MSANPTGKRKRVARGSPRRKRLRSNRFALRRQANVRWRLRELAPPRQNQFAAALHCESWSSLNASSSTRKATKLPASRTNLAQKRRGAVVISAFAVQVLPAQRHATSDETSIGLAAGAASSATKRCVAACAVPGMTTVPRHMSEAPKAAASRLLLAINPVMGGTFQLLYETGISCYTQLFRRSQLKVASNN